MSSSSWKHVKTSKLPNGLEYRQFKSKSSPKEDLHMAHAIYDPRDAGSPMVHMETSRADDIDHPHASHWINAAPEHRGKGLGRQLLLATLVHGTGKLASDNFTTPEADKAWRSISNHPGIQFNLSEFSDKNTNRHTASVADMSKLDMNAMFPSIKQDTKKNDIEIAPDKSNNRETYLDSFEKKDKDSALALAQALEDYANDNIPQKEKAFGDFMYHAELIRNNHNSVHIKDMSMIEPKYLKIMQRIIDEHSQEKLDKSEVCLEIFDNTDIDLTMGEQVSDSTEEDLVKAILDKGYEEINKKEWSPKAKHKSDKGGLTAAGRASYNRATGGNLKAPQPGGGPRKRSFCARNAGQIRMHNIDCRKTPDKRACKARRRWKC
jgi:hypothetical protein